LNGFYGTFTGVIDEKGRLSIPSKLRAVELTTAKKKSSLAGEPMYLTEGLDGCLSLYPETEWQKIEARLNSLSFTQKNFRYFNRRLHQNTVPVRVDKSGRIHIPEQLQKLAGLEKEVLIIGVHHAIEIWNPDRHKNYIEGFEGSYEDVAETLFRNEFGQ
jgi:MraZ protein